MSRNRDMEMGKPSLLVTLSYSNLNVLRTRFICSSLAQYAKLKAYRHRRTFALVGMSIVLTLILMAKHENTVRYISSDMERVSSQQVWEYVSDFSNMVNLNPTM